LGWGYFFDEGIKASQIGMLEEREKERGRKKKKGEKKNPREKNTHPHVETTPPPQHPTSFFPRGKNDGMGGWEGEWLVGVRVLFLPPWRDWFWFSHFFLKNSFFILSTSQA
jgi:hypothetical protein